ncbi:MAG: hypothetical protein A2849_02335 [Candidatus Taylorbacteria bacterium RIFCSPHIGHO2_01_FULL_51_15]|uniref:Uncharacterized protein n=1 Tax=Candidatus Taylorbacteria bacterium RIFCSPHIGHO2_01_FULL_51_15 TaxID=1802304 RepID=A0A1G2MCL0_9BACT|nr:MAG: hypothetical protein A2849_02335 [Candidatus Taylorbacteria bacterium RIFCSPHIGHO2_01_FULL_51_15]
MTISAIEQPLTSEPGVRKLEPGAYGPYARLLERASRQLRAYYNDNESSEKDSMGLYTEKLLRTMRALRIKFSNSPHYLGRPGIALTDSGFPQYADVQQLETDLLTRGERLPKFRPIPELKDAFLNHVMLATSETDRALFDDRSNQFRWEISERTYLEMLDLRTIFFTFTPGKLFPAEAGQWEKEKGRRAYHFSWGCYDAQTNRPYVYFILVTQDETERRLDEPNNPEYVKFLDGVRAIATRAPENLMGIAVSLDESFTHLYPKVLKRICIGPLVAPMLYKDVQDLSPKLIASRLLPMFERAKLTNEDFVLLLATEIVFSEREARGRSPLLSLTKSKMRQIFHVPKNDQILLRRGASVIQTYAIMPHRLRQHLEKEDFTGLAELRGAQFLTYEPQTEGVSHVG